MAKSLADALKQAGLKKESFRPKRATITLPIESRPENQSTVGKSKGEPTFEEQMRKEGVSKAADVKITYRTASAKSIGTHQGRSPQKGKDVTAGGPRLRQLRAPKGGTRNQRAAREKADIDRYLTKISNAYGNRGRKRSSAIDAPRGLILEITGPVRANSLLLETDLGEIHLLSHRQDGRCEQIAVPGTEIDEVDIIVGLDFGTSSVKAVIRDKARGSYAVPFYDQAINPHLLPSRVYEFNGTYQLQNGGVPHRDLKLSLLRKDSGPDDLERAAAFLGLVIRHCRGWFLSSKGETYQKTRLNWSINLGLPAANYEDDGLVRRFRVLAVAAMNLASDDSESINRELAVEHCERARLLVSEPEGSLIHRSSSISVDLVDVVPEIAAQIYGFVQSSRFDTKQANIYMMVDVGAGTVDASIFHVRKEPAGRYGFVFFANNVEQNGVVNLHRDRIDWLLEKCQASEEDRSAATRAISECRRPTDRLSAIPESVEDYFEGIMLHFTKAQDNPDEIFFMRRYWRQLFGGTLNFVRDKKLYESQLTDLPFFLAGGGARMKYYNRFLRQINSNDNIRWARLRPLPLERPRELEAPGLRADEYDRLSVAFGLSFLKLGTYVRAQQVPDLPPRRTADYYDRFVSKDQV